MIPRTDERPNCIGLQVDGKYSEGRCQAAFLPGTLLEITTFTLDGDTVEKNNAQLPPYMRKNTVSGNAVVFVALEDRLGNAPGNIFGRTINTPYVPVSGIDSTVDGWYGGDVVGMISPKPGDVFMCRVATNAHIPYGTLLKAHSDGTLIAQGGSGTAIAFAAEDRNFAHDEPGVATPLLRVQFI